MRFKGARALVTGASSGIGRAIAVEFAREGADVCIAARRADRLEEVASGVRALGRRAVVSVCDVTREADVRATVAAAVAALGGLDAVVANAGIGVTGHFEKLTADDFRRQFETNVFGALHTAMAAVPELAKSRGRLALIGSVMGHVPLPKSAPYTMSKFAVTALAQTLQYDLRAKGVSTTLVSPGFVESEIRRKDNDGAPKDDPVPSWLVMPAETAARKIVRAMARRRREIVITIHGKVAVWIHRHFPWLIRAVVR